jgi:predicted transcriptional regulator
MAEANGRGLRTLVAEVAAGYFANAHVSPAEIPRVIRQIADSLAGIASASDSAPADAVATSAATRAQVRKSITPDALISFEDGKPYKTLRRHLASRGLSPVQYRAKWGLPWDYPMVSPSYSEARSTLAKALGFGKQNRQARRKSRAPVTRSPGAAPI